MQIFAEEGQRFLRRVWMMYVYIPFFGWVSGLESGCPYDRGSFILKVGACYTDPEDPSSVVVLQEVWLSRRSPCWQVGAVERFKEDPNHKQRLELE